MVVFHGDESSHGDESFKNHATQNPAWWPSPPNLSDSQLQLEYRKNCMFFPDWRWKKYPDSWRFQGDSQESHVLCEAGSWRSDIHPPTEAPSTTKNSATIGETQNPGSRCHHFKKWWFLLEDDKSLLKSWWFGNEKKKTVVGLPGSSSVKNPPCRTMVFQKTAKKRCGMSLCHTEQRRENSDVLGRQKSLISMLQGVSPLCYVWLEIAMGDVWKGEAPEFYPSVPQILSISSCLFFGWEIYSK